MLADVLALDCQGLKVCGGSDTVRKGQFWQKEERSGCLARTLSLWADGASLVKSRLERSPPTGFSWP